MNIRQTHTLAQLNVSAATYAEIRTKLEAAGYQHAFLDDKRDGEMIDMSGIALCSPQLQKQEADELLASKGG